MQPYILVIEDDPLLGQLPLKVANQLKIQAVLDQNGNQYSQCLQRLGPPALVLLDLHLPFASGADILQSLRANPQMHNIPIIIATADIIQARDLESRNERVLLKPYSMARLQEIFADILFPS